MLRILLGVVTLAASTGTAVPSRAQTVLPQASRAAATVQPGEKHHVVVFKEPGRYGGWPANGGVWSWGEEIVVGFTAAWYKPAKHDHAVDRGKPFEKWQARSLDGGLTWSIEKPPGFVGDGQTPKCTALQEPLDFTQPGFALVFHFLNMHVGPSYFHVSMDRGRSWRGPYSFAVEGIDKIAARTDYLVLGRRECLMFGSAAKANNREGRPFCARTADGGLHWKLLSLIGPEPPGFAIMPSTLRLSGGGLLTTIRQGHPGQGSGIEAYRSDDGGRRWTRLGDATPNIGGNPPSLVRLHDGRLCLTYGYRLRPFGARARITADEGRGWGPEIILRDDGLTGDLGYPRSVVRPDGQIVTIYYFNGPRDEDRTIQATLWTPPGESAQEQAGRPARDR
jgi:hypothetical protein